MAKEQITKKECRELIGEAVHTAFRKGSDHPSAGKVWNAIHEMPRDEWRRILKWMVWAMFYDGKDS